MSESPSIECDRGLPLLVVIMPALNEEKTVADVIQRIPTRIEGVREVQVIVVDDGSTDATADAAREAGAVVCSHGRNRGVGAAFSTGIDAALGAGADIIVNMDSDGQFDPNGIAQMIEPILNRSAGFVTCSRFKDPELIPDMPWIKKWGNRMMCHLINSMIWRAKFTDVSCGFRAYSRDTALQLNLYGRFTYTQETFIDLVSKGITVEEVSLKVRGVRQFGESRVASNVWKYATQTLPIILTAIRDVRPLGFFGSIALLFLALSVLLYGVVTTQWLMTGHTSPWTSLITLGTATLAVGTIVGVMALIADQLGRGRRIQERLLYFERKRHYDQWASRQNETAHSGTEKPAESGIPSEAVSEP